MTQLAITPSTEIEAFKPFAANLADFTKRYDVIYDMDDPKQNKAARTDRVVVAGAIKALDAKHKELKASLKEQVDILDSARKEIKDPLEKIRLSLQNQAKDHDALLQDHQDFLDRKVDVLRFELIFGFLSAAGLSTDRVRSALEELKAVVIDESYEDRAEKAVEVHGESMERLASILAEYEKRDADAKELEELRNKQAEQDRIDEAQRQKDRDDQMKQEAAEQAVAGERQKVEAEQQASAPKPQMANEVEQKPDKTHQINVFYAAVEGMVVIGVDDAIAEKIVSAIANDKIPYLSIAY